MLSPQAYARCPLIPPDVRGPLIPRDYARADMREAIDRHARDRYRLVALLYGVGGGKTPTSLGLAALWLEDATYTHVIVVVTLESVGDQFMSYGLEQSRFGGQFEFEGKVCNFPRPYVRHVATGRELSLYLATHNNTGSKGSPRYERMIVVHSSTLLHELPAVERAMGDERKRLLLIVDEGHHAHTVDTDDEGDTIGTDDTELSRALSHLHQHYRFLELKLTGTPYRTDNRQVVPTSETLRFERRLVWLMLNGWAPERIVTEYREVPGDHEVAAAMLVRQWVEDGRPSVLVRIKPRDQATNRATVAAFVEAFARAGASVIDTTREAGAAALKEAIAADAAGELETGSVFLSITRMVEGVDIRSLTHAYFWGVPRSMLVLEQVLGRIMRQRLHDGQQTVNCAPEWANQSKAVFFLGQSMDHTAETETDHARLILRVCIFMSLLEHPRWLVRELLGIHDGLRPVPPSGPRNPMQQLLDPVEMVLALEAREAFIATWRRLVHPFSLDPATKPEKFVAAFCKWYREEWRPLQCGADPQLSDDVLRHALMNTEARYLDRGTRRNPRDDAPDPASDVFDGIAEVLEVEDGRLDIQAELIERVTRTFATSFVESSGVRTVHDVIRCADSFVRLRRRWPRHADQDQAQQGRAVTFGYYVVSILKVAGYRDLGEALCLTRSDDLPAAWAMAVGITRDRNFRVLDRRSELEDVRSVISFNPFAAYYAEALLLGVELGWDKPPEGVAAKELLDTLDALRVRYSTRAKRDILKRTAAKSGFAGVLAVVVESRAA